MTKIHDFSESYEMYLKTVAELSDGEKAIPITAVAQRLGVATVSASEMMHRLEEHGLLKHQPYKGVFLTDEGTNAAGAVVRAHRLWERFLVDSLGIDWTHAHEVACDLEHATSVEVSHALDSFLDFPERCPHGNPIPRPGQAIPSEGPLLSTLSANQRALIENIRPESSQVLIALSDRGIFPGIEVEVVEIEVFDGPRRLNSEKGSITLGRRLADHIHVQVLA